MLTQVKTVSPVIVQGWNRLATRDVANFYARTGLFRHVRGS